MGFHVSPRSKTCFTTENTELRGIGARTSDYPGRIGMKAFDRFYVAVPEGVRHGAQVWMYSVQK